MSQRGHVRVPQSKAGPSLRPMDPEEEAQLPPNVLSLCHTLAHSGVWTSRAVCRVVL